MDCWIESIYLRNKYFNGVLITVYQALSGGTGESEK